VFRVAFAVTIYLGATRDLSAQITQDAYVDTGVNQAQGTLQIIDTAKQQVAGLQFVKGAPVAFWVSPHGLLLYYTSSFDNFAGVLDLVSGNVLTIPAGPFPAGITVSPNGLYAYVAAEIPTADSRRCNIRRRLK
jgi:DNA-binding beta-propeller fold protein YncE